MKTKMSKSMLMTALICGSIVPVLYGGASVYAAEAAAEDALSSFELNPMIITAQRVETNDLNTPAAVEIYDEKKIEQSGAANAFDVLQDSLGVFIHSQGFNGTAMGTMTSKIMIRGVQQGTLVLVNGVPMNMDGKYNLEDIPTESIERIELVRGGGSVLYGSEATGGVINIITKNKMKNKVSVAAGNYGKEKYNLSLGIDRFNVVAGLENRGSASPMSRPPSGTGNGYDYDKGERKSILWNYKITDGLVFTHAYSKNEHRYEQRAFPEGKHEGIFNDYTDKDNNFFLNYDKDGWKATVAYGTQEKETFYHGIRSKKPTEYVYAWRKGHNTNINVQKQFKVGKGHKDSFLIGANYQREDMDTFGYTNSRETSLKRNNASIYLSYNWAMNDRSNLMVNMRQTWATGIDGKQTRVEKGKTIHEETHNANMNKFTPEVEYIYRFNDRSSLYAKAGKSFRMPNLTQIFGTGNINPTLDLKPEQGTHYEVGYKLNEGNRSWRLSVFNFKIKDAIEADAKDLNNIKYYNCSLRNTGVELALNIKHNENLSTSWGLMFNNPQQQDNKTFGDNAWHDYYGKYQLQCGVNYDKGKFSGALKLNYVGDRTAQSADQRHLKPQFFTNLHLSYSPEKNHKFFLHVNNILDRLDITSNSTSNYYTLGRNFMAGYEFSF